MRRIGIIPRGGWTIYSVIFRARWWENARVLARIGAGFLVLKVHFQWYIFNYFAIFVCYFNSIWFSIFIICYCSFCIFKLSPIWILWLLPVPVHSAIIRYFLLLLLHHLLLLFLFLFLLFLLIFSLII